MKYCLACVATPDFMPGVLVMLHSFLRHNIWFEGDVIILHDALSDADQAKLRDLSNKVKIREISPEMAQATQQLLQRRPEMAPRSSSFYKGDLLSQHTYDKVILSDSDIVYRASIENIIKKPDLLMACGDGAFYHAKLRSTFDYTINDDTHSPHLKSTFSAGFVVMDRKLCGALAFRAFLDCMAQFTQTQFISGNTDQAIFNVMFDGVLTRLDCKYNYHLLHKDIIKAKTGKSFEDAIVLHFGGKAKPWNLGDAIVAIAADPDLKDIFDVWRLAYMDYTAFSQDIAMK